MQHSFCHQKSSEGFHRPTTSRFSSLSKWRVDGWVETLLGKQQLWSGYHCAMLIPFHRVAFDDEKMRSTPTIRGTPKVRRGSRISFRPSSLTCESRRKACHRHSVRQRQCPCMAYRDCESSGMLPGGLMRMFRSKPERTAPSIDLFRMGRMT